MRRCCAASTTVTRSFDAGSDGCVASSAAAGKVRCGSAVVDKLVQQALVRTYLAWNVAREREPLAYARRVLANLRIDDWRRTRREVLVSPQDLPDSAEGDGAEDRAVGDELVWALQRPTPRRRRVVVLRYVHVGSVAPHRRKDVVMEDTDVVARLRAAHDAAPLLAAEPASVVAAARRRRGRLMAVRAAGLVVVTALAVTGLSVRRGSRTAPHPSPRTALRARWAWLACGRSTRPGRRPTPSCGWARSTGSRACGYAARAGP
jgi:hypothetical protein